MSQDISIETLRVRVRDGVALHVASYRARSPSRARAVLCLPGLTRNGRDFHDLALAMAAAGRTVHTLDARGRGHSDWDKDWRNYTIPYEAQDVLDVLMALSLDAPAIVGTSRGGLVAMVMAALQPGAFGPVVLNDIGPVIETKGLTRIAGYIGRTGTPPTWEEAATFVAAANRKAFPAVPDNQWAAVARQWFNDKDGRPAEGYDPALARTMSVKDGTPPALWAQYLAFGARPVLVIRGERSDILSDATLDEMKRRLPQCQTLTVPGEGHAPLLSDAPTIAAIVDFLAAADTVESPALRAAALG